MARRPRFRLRRSRSGQAMFAGIAGRTCVQPIGPCTAATPQRCSICLRLRRATRLSATQAYTTLELKVAYHKAIMRDTGRLRAIGKIVSFGRRAAFTEGTLVDDEGRLYASATSTLLIVERKQ